MIGKHFGSYKIESKIGEGGMGVVYRARDLDLDRAVAIKIVSESRTTKEGSESTEAVARFLREAKAASRLQHPSIVHIYKFGVEENTRYLVMEYIEGKNLRAIINRRPLPVDRICEIAVQIADALTVAHEMGVVHRDLKVENIMVTPRGQAKVLDFGLAKVVETILPSADEPTVDDSYKTQLGTVLGTVSSMAPEQALGKSVDAKADIFSLGVVLYEMATGQNPFLGPTAQATLARILNHQPELVSLVNPEIPPELERLIHLCLRKEPKQRPSAQEVTNTCKRLLASMNKWAVPESGSSAAPGPVLVPASAPLQPVAASLPVKPPSASQIPSAHLPMASDPATISRLTAVYRAVKAFRIVFALATITVPLSFFFYMLVGAQVIRVEVVEGTIIWAYIKAIVIPVLAESDKIFAVRPVVNGWNLMLAALGVVVLVVRHGLMLPVERLEFAAKAKLARARSSPLAGAAAAVSDRGVSNRLSLLRQYAEGRRTSGKGKRTAFLSIDIVGWSRMGVSEDPLVAEHALAEYKKFVDRILRTQGALKTAFMAEGILSAFQMVDDAVGAAQSILKELPWFNDGVHKLHTAFHVRCGINAGEVAIGENQRLEEVNSDVINVAAHMQRSAPPDALWLSGEILALVSNSAGFDMVRGQEVDGRTAYEWRAPAVSQQLKSSSAIGAD